VFILSVPRWQGPRCGPGKASSSRGGRYHTDRRPGAALQNTAI
jgi:hypothetical protein